MGSARPHTVDRAAALLRWLPPVGDVLDALNERMDSFINQWLSAPPPEIALPGRADFGPASPLVASGSHREPHTPCSAHPIGYSVVLCRKARVAPRLARR